MAIERELEPGTQVIYVPMHAEGNIAHPDCEAGFVTSLQVPFAFVRYFYPGGELRTVANGERTAIGDLRIANTRMQEEVDHLMVELGYWTEVARW